MSNVIKTLMRNDYSIFKLLQHQIKTESLITYNNYLNLIQSDLLLNPKLFWTYVLSRKRVNSIPQTML